MTNVFYLEFIIFNLFSICFQFKLITVLEFVLHQIFNPLNNINLSLFKLIANFRNELAEGEKDNGNGNGNGSEWECSFVHKPIFLKRTY